MQVLQVTSGANTTSYLYGLNQVGEFGSQSVYYLTDGVGSIRHLVDPNGAVKLARMYEPFGQVLMQTGVGDPIYGYLGAQFDRISGLMYINGAYYDPVKGRFLTPSSGGSNPYVPLSGAVLAPILILALLGRRKKGKIWTGWVVVALVMSASLVIAACGTAPNIPVEIPPSWPPGYIFQLPDPANSPYRTDHQTVLNSTIRFEVSISATPCPPSTNLTVAGDATGTYMGNGHIYTHHHISFASLPIGKEYLVISRLQKWNGEDIFSGSSANDLIPLSETHIEVSGENTDIKIPAAKALLLEQKGVQPAERGDPNQIIPLTQSAVVAVPFWNESASRYEVLDAFYVADLSGQLHTPSGSYTVSLSRTLTPNEVTNQKLEQIALIQPGDSGGGLWYRNKVVGNTWKSETRSVSDNTIAVVFSGGQAGLMPSSFTFSP